MPWITFGGRHDHHYHTWIDEGKLFAKLNLIIEKLDVLEQGENKEEIQKVIIRIDKIIEQLKKTV